MNPASDIERIWSTCNACGSDAFEQILKVGEWIAGRCSVCSLIYVNPIPFFKKTDYYEIAKVSYYTKFQHDITTEKIDFKKNQLRAQFDEICRLPARSGSAVETPMFLDVGCGPGLAVRAAVELGWKAVGIDLDSELIGLGKQQLGVDVRCGDLMENRFEDGQFDFIYFLSVLHLLPNPFDVLVEVKRILSQNGAVSIVVPNQNGLLNRLSMLAGKKRQKRYGTLVFPYHLHAFTPATLKRVILRSGLKLHLIKTSSPIDPRYAAIDQVADGNSEQKFAKFAWKFAEMIQQGSVLIAYAGK